MLQQEQFTGHAALMAARVIGVAMALLAAPAWAERFMAPLAGAQWQVERSPLSCRLRQAVPRYGDAIFEAQAGGRQRFLLRAAANPMIEGPAVLVAAAPAWNPERAEVPLGTVAIAAGAEPLRLENAEAQRLLDSLNDGLAPQFSRPLQSDRERDALLGLSPANFRPAYREYQACIARMVPVSYEQVASTTISFRAERAELTAQAQQKIDEMLRYAQADRTVTGFSLHAVSSDAPRRLENLSLSKERAQQVHEYLMSRGIAAAKISSEYRGERNGRGDLRAVTIRLLRAQ